jgi:hypothetical protein
LTTARTFSGRRVTAVALVTVAVGVAVNQVLNGGRWDLQVNP